MVTASQLQSLATAYLAPCPGDERAGANPSFDPRYERMKTAIVALDSPTGEPVDWSEIAATGKTILADVGKDLLAASYTTYALMQTRRLEGLATGLAVLLGLLEQYWDTMFPPAKRMRGRGNALEWLTSRLEHGIGSLEVSADDRPHLDLSIEAWKQFSSVCREKLEDHCPPLRGVADALTRLDMRLPKEASSEVPPQETPTASPDAAETRPSTSSEASSAASAAPEPSTASQQPQDGPAVPVLERLRQEASVWVTPIPGDSPQGVDPRYQPEYEQARAEVAKLDAPGADPPTWDVVYDSASSVLKSRGKDLLMAAYWAFASFKKHGLARVPLGLVTIAELLEQFGENLFPSRPKGRGNAVGWLVDMLDNHLAEVKLTATDRPVVADLDAAQQHFAAAVRTHLEDHGPSLSSLGNRIKRMQLSLPAEAKPEPPKPPEPPKAPDPPKPATAQSPTPDASGPSAASRAAPSGPGESLAVPTEVAEAEPFLNEMGTALSKTANLLLTADLKNPQAYRLMRHAAWLLVDGPPPHQNNKTTLGTPPAAKWQALVDQAFGSTPDKVVGIAERSIKDLPFLLSLHWLSWTALDRMGPEYAAAKDTIVAEVRAFLARVPDLPNLTARDDTPLASEETRKWLDEHVLVAVSAEVNGGPAPDDPGPAMEEVKQLLLAKKKSEAMALAQTSIQESGPRLRLIRRISLAEALLSTGEGPLAHSIFLALDRELTDRRLFEWEASLASRCLQGLIRSAPKANPAAGRKSDADTTEFLGRLCLIDPAAASRLSPSK